MHVTALSLVQEMAERRMRPTSADRRLIADRSAKSLRMLATPLRIYRDRSSVYGAPPRRSVNLTDYPTAPSDELEMEEDEEEFENAYGNAAATVEGASLNSEMYDAFGGSSHRWSSHPGLTMSRRTLAEESSAMASNSSDDNQLPDALRPTVSYSTSPVTRPSPWSFPSNSSLFRTTTVRRPVRSRTVDFNDFTSRRRSSIRQGTTQDILAPRIDVPEDSSRSLSAWERPSIPASPVIGRSPQSARRFFGLTRNRRHDPNGSLLFRDIALPGASSEPGDLSYWTVEADSSGPWFGSRQPYFSNRYQPHEVEGSEERTHDEIPRLRRGGVRAPESMLSRNASPSPERARIDAPAPIVTFTAPVGAEDAVDISEILTDAI